MRCRCDVCIVLYGVRETNINGEEDRVTSPSQVAGATQDAAGKTAGAAKNEAAQVGQAATSAAADVAGTAKEQVGAVTGEAVSQVKDLVGQARGEFSQQAGNATAKLGDSVRALVAELHEMSSAGQKQGPATEVVRQLAERGDKLADYLSNKQPSDMLQELRSFASQRPGGFLLGALAAGVLTGRVVRGATAAGKDSPSGSTYPAVGGGSTYDTASTYGTGSTGGSTYGRPVDHDAPVLDPAPTIETVPTASSVRDVPDEDLVIRPGATHNEPGAGLR